MKPITTTDLTNALEWMRIHLELRKTKQDVPLSNKDIDTIDRNTLAYHELKRMVKMVRDFGGLEKIKELLATATQAKQPNLFGYSEVQPVEAHCLEDLAHPREGLFVGHTTP